MIPWKALLASYRPGYSLPGAFYSDPEVYAEDFERIWQRGWLMAGHACEAAEPGDFFVYEIGDESLLIMRGDDGRLRALFNVCRHRGSVICSQPQGQVGKLVCPYHQWTYGRDGRLLGTGGMADALDRSQWGLHQAPLREVAGLVFVSLASNPPDFDEAYAAMEPEIRPQGLERAKVACQKHYSIGANWKLVWENNRECLHCPVGHPQYVQANFDVAPVNDPVADARIEARSVSCEQRWRALGLKVGHRTGGLTRFPDRTWYRANRTPLVDGWVSESLDGRPVAPLMGDYPERDMGTLRISTLPNFWNHSSSDHAVSTRLTPAGPQRTLATVTWLVDREAIEGRDYQLEAMLPFWQLTSEQDWVLCENNQRGVNSKRYTPGPYSPTKEYNVEAFVRWYLREIEQPQ